MTRLRAPAERVSPRAVSKWATVGAVQAVVVLVAAGLASYLWQLFEMRWWIAVLLGAWAAVVILVIPPLRYRVHRWEATETAVYTQSGWWSIERRIAPMSRIQTVDYAQGPVDRIFGLATVTVTTASAAGALEIDGLDRTVAVRLAEELTATAAAVEGDAT